MRIIIIRHGDPDYAHDSLTEKGFREAKMLGERIDRENIKDFYVSPYGRAQATAAAAMKNTGKTAVTLEWLKEFEPRIRRPDRNGGRTRVWDWMPDDWTEYDGFYDYDHWANHPLMQEADVRSEYDHICRAFDALLAGYGYEHAGRIFHVREGSHDTICLFCHFGLEMILISHLLHMSPMPLWHGFAASPSAVTVIYSEEREKGTACFRIRQFGDISHLYIHGEEPSFAARYSECFEDQTKH